mgnify:FL=1
MTAEEVHDRLTGLALISPGRADKLAARLAAAVVGYWATELGHRTAFDLLTAMADDQVKAIIDSAQKPS